MVSGLHRKAGANVGASEPIEGIFRPLLIQFHLALTLSPGLKAELVLPTSNTERREEENLVRFQLEELEELVSFQEVAVSI